MFFLSHLGGCEGWADRCDERVGEKTKTRFRDKGAGGSHSRWTTGNGAAVGLRVGKNGGGEVDAQVGERVGDRNVRVKRDKWTHSNCSHPKCTKLCWSRESNRTNPQQSNRLEGRRNRDRKIAVHSRGIETMEMEV
jgi:hypothetical protein